MTIDLILGSAGHIDHGKTSLIRALTGVDTDRLPEEKRRGITIELGFAELLIEPYSLGIVDVPGHERFVRNMLAGATGMDLAMLVVAADDSVKPQTIEHVEILKLLNLPAGVIAITKSDLVEPDWLDLVEDEVRQLVSETFLHDAPIIRTSASERTGLDDLRDALASGAERAVAARGGNPVSGPFRMPVDRTFTIAGHGTVVTGSISSGQTQVGDELVLEPGNVAVRIKGLQHHDRSVQQVHRGQRAAINLAGIHHEAVRRGQELATVGHLSPSRILTVNLAMLKSAPRPLKHRGRVRVHVGTAEYLASVLLLGRERLEPGERAPAQLLLSAPAVTTWNQPLVIRSESPVTTIGGGQVLDPCAERVRRADEVILSMMEQLRSPDVVQRSSAALYFAGLRNWKPEDLSRTAGIDDPTSVYAALCERGDVHEIAISPVRKMRVHRQRYADLGARIRALLESLHEQFPLRTVLDRNLLNHAFDYLDRPLLDAIIHSLRKEGHIRVTEKGVALEGAGPKLSQNERKLLAQLIDSYRDAGVQPPSVADLQKKTTKNQSSVPQLVALAAADGNLVELTNEYYLHADIDRDLREKLGPLLESSGGLTMSQIREILETSRKYAVPYCEYLDRIGFTRRDGDLRMLASGA